eukprot:TRINITY_DN4997_c0_g3_i12.p1 TRINITY_DN4997_c0_g3~~TRINITY_DN4997_c0_g3_i12.p1  ORF type:complete len:335 (+),score=-20.55 TRINITY_DN4997_c0_g3_i12:27-1007(+)
MIRRPPRSTLSSSSAASDVYKRQILEAMGNTPTVKLNRLTDENDATIYVKYEGVNIGGSIKTRTAYNMIMSAKEKGIINDKTTIIEPTSGNQGVGLALIGAVMGIKVKIVMPDSVSEERMRLIKSYGAEVTLIKDNNNIGECIENCLSKAIELSKEIENSFIPQQFTNPDNPDVHRKCTAKEILKQIDKPIDGFCCGIGTGGTITGVGEVLKEKYPNIKIWALEPDNAAILLNREIKSHIQMGIGDGIIPENLNCNIYSEVHTISDKEALETAKKLIKFEGIMCGISSGTNVAGALKMAKILGKGKTIVTILPDTGERYFSTELFE